MTRRDLDLVFINARDFSSLWRSRWHSFISRTWARDSLSFRSLKALILVTHSSLRIYYYEDSEKDLESRTHRLIIPLIISGSCNVHQIKHVTLHPGNPLLRASILFMELSSIRQVGVDPYPECVVPGDLSVIFPCKLGGGFHPGRVIAEF